MQTSTIKAIKKITKIIIQIFLLVVSLYIMEISIFTRAFYPDLGSFGFGVCMFFCTAISLFYCQKSRIFWFVHIVLITVYLMCFSHVSMLW